jgi:hypothetical protein
MDTKQKKNTKNIRHQNVLESLKDIGGDTADTLKKDVLRGQDLLDQILGNARSYSGEISAGESVEMSEVFTGQREENEKLKKQISNERNLREEEKVLTEQKSNELRVQLHAIMKEVQALADTTQELANEVQVATMQAPVEPGIYHVIFFEKLLEFIKSFRAKVEDASVWLHATNKRAEKKNYWSKYKKHGSSFLLSADHYLSRSAG